MQAAADALAAAGASGNSSSGSAGDGGGGGGGGGGSGVSKWTSLQSHVVGAHHEAAMLAATSNSHAAGLSAAEYLEEYRIKSVVQVRNNNNQVSGGGSACAADATARLRTTPPGLAAQTFPRARARTRPTWRSISPPPPSHPSHPNPVLSYALR